MQQTTSDKATQRSRSTASSMRSSAYYLRDRPPVAVRITAPPGEHCLLPRRAAAAPIR